jgi:hypothetical protein
MLVARVKPKWARKQPTVDVRNRMQSARALLEHCEAVTPFDGSIRVTRPVRAAYTAVRVRLRFYGRPARELCFAVTPANRDLVRRLGCVLYPRDMATLLPVGVVALVYELMHGAVVIRGMPALSVCAPFATNGRGDVYASLRRVRRDGKCFVGFTTAELHALRDAPAVDDRTALAFDIEVQPRSDDSDESDEEEPVAAEEERVQAVDDDVEIEDVI